jgi:hypothetical protein
MRKLTKMLSIIKIKKENMDYQEWLLNEYVVRIAPFTSSSTWAKWIGIITAGTLVVSFGNIILEWANSKGLALIMPTVETNYTTYNTDIISPAVDNLVVVFEGWGLSPVGNIIEQVWSVTDYFITEVLFAYLDGSLTSDTEYA